MPLAAFLVMAPMNFLEPNSYQFFYSEIFRLKNAGNIYVCVSLNILQFTFIFFNFFTWALKFSAHFLDQIEQFVNDVY